MDRDREARQFVSGQNVIEELETSFGEYRGDAHEADWKVIREAFEVNSWHWGEVRVVHDFGVWLSFAGCRFPGLLIFHRLANWKKDEMLELPPVGARLEVRILAHNNPDHAFVLTQRNDEKSW